MSCSAAVFMLVLFSLQKDYTEYLMTKKKHCWCSVKYHIVTFYDAVVKSQSAWTEVSFVNVAKCKM